MVGVEVTRIHILFSGTTRARLRYNITEKHTGTASKATSGGMPLASLLRTCFHHVGCRYNWPDNPPNNSVCSSAWHSDYTVAGRLCLPSNPFVLPDTETTSSSVLSNSRRSAPQPSILPPEHYIPYPWV